MFLWGPDFDNNFQFGGQCTFSKERDQCPYDTKLFELYITYKLENWTKPNYT